MTATIYAGIANPERCAEIHRALTGGAKVKDLAEAYGCSPTTVRNQSKRHEKAARYTVVLQRDGERELTLCDVITPGGAMGAAVAVFRHYAGTLKGLELPGWRLVVSDVAFKLEDVRKEASPKTGRDA